MNLRMKYQYFSLEILFVDATKRQESVVHLTTIWIKGDKVGRWTHIGVPLLYETEIPLANIDRSGTNLSANSLSYCQELKRAWPSKILDSGRYGPVRQPSFPMFSVFVDNYPSDAIRATSRILLFVFRNLFSMESLFDFRFYFRICLSR